MKQTDLDAALDGLPLGRLAYFERIGSTNDLAAQWAASGAPDLSLIVADEQTEGRGRAGRQWFTPPGAALAFTVLLRPSGNTSSSHLPRYTGLGALVVCETLAADFGLQSQIKWPNDVLIARHKACGVLAEAHWLGEELQAILLGIGINVAPPSVPPDEQLNFPATCVEAHTGAPIDRLALLRRVLEKLIEWRKVLNTPQFIAAWQARLAFVGEWVQISAGSSQDIIGKLLGLDDGGRLKLELRSGEIKSVQVGEVHLRPSVDSQPK